jgi:hypothetical protein
MKKLSHGARSALRQAHLYGYLVERDRRFYYPGGKNEVCSRADFAMLLDEGLLEKHGTRYEITTEGRRTVLDNLA